MKPASIITGLVAAASLSGCLLLNDVAQVEAPGYAPAIDAATRYLVFDVPPGYYVGGASNVVFMAGYAGALAFEVPAGRVVYVGDLVHAENHRTP